MVPMCQQPLCGNLPFEFENGDDCTPLSPWHAVFWTRTAIGGKGQPGVGSLFDFHSRLRRHTEFPSAKKL
jgi:hypothetical protein